MFERDTKNFAIHVLYCIPSKRLLLKYCLINRQKGTQIIKINYYMGSTAIIEVTHKRYVKLTYMKSQFAPNLS